MKSELAEDQIFLPVTLNIRNKKILILGGGHVAAHKLQTLLKFTSHITVLAREFLPEIRSNPNLRCITKSYEKKDLADFYLVYACTDDRLLNAQIKKDANEMGLLVNVADDPELCDFISPAIYKIENLTVSVGSNARDVKRAIRIRNWIKEKMKNGEVE